MSSPPFCGMKNLGATCYLNSLLVCLSHSSPLFSKLLSDISPISIPSKPEEGSDGMSDYLDDKRIFDFMHHFLLFLSLLQDCELKYLDPTSFVHLVRDYDGTCLSPFEQRDANEFIHLLFHSLESITNWDYRDTEIAMRRYLNNLEALRDQPPTPGTKSTLERIISSCFGGTLETTLSSLSSEYTSSRSETFMTLTLEVGRGINSVQEGIRRVFEPEKMSGENGVWIEERKEREEAMRTTIVQSLPPTLILHLKRFDFDLAEMRRVKINDYFSFPHTFTFNLTTDDEVDENGQTILKENKIEYELVCVMNHVGVAEGGHYYSFLKTSKDSTISKQTFKSKNDQGDNNNEGGQNGPDEEEDDGEEDGSGEWWEVNDREVKKVVDVKQCEVKEW